MAEPENPRRNIARKGWTPDSLISGVSQVPETLGHGDRIIFTNVGGSIPPDEALAMLRMDAALPELRRKMALETLRDTVKKKAGEHLHLERVKSMLIIPESGVVTPTDIERVIYGETRNPDPLPKVRLPDDHTPDLDRRDDRVARIAKDVPNYEMLEYHSSEEFQAIKDQLKLFFWNRALGKSDVEIWPVTDHLITIIENVSAFNITQPAGSSFTPQQAASLIFEEAYDKAYVEFLSEFFSKNAHHGRNEGEIYDRLHESFEVLLSEIDMRMAEFGKGQVDRSGGIT